MNGAIKVFEITKQMKLLTGLWSVEENLGSGNHDGNLI